VRVWVIGDSGTESARPRYGTRSPPTAPINPADVWLMLGDNAYTSGTDAQYQTAVFDVFPQMLRTSRCGRRAATMTRRSGVHRRFHAARER
jgi:hypothetical protein